MKEFAGWLGEEAVIWRRGPARRWVRKGQPRPLTVLPGSGRPESCHPLTSVTVSCGTVANLGDEKVKPLSVPAS